MSATMLNDSKSVPLSSMLRCPEWSCRASAMTFTPVPMVSGSGGGVGPRPGVLEALFWVLASFAMQITPGDRRRCLDRRLTGIAGQAGRHATLPCLHDDCRPGGLGVGLSVLALRWRVGKNWMSEIHLRRPALVPCLLAVVCLPFVSLLAIGACVFVVVGLGVGVPAGLAELDSMGPMWLVLLIVAVTGPINEELFCRGFLGRGLVGRYGVVLGVLLTSVYFALIHGNIPQGAVALVLGCYLHLAYLATRSLWVPVLLHLLHNTCATLMGLFISEADLTSGQPDFSAFQPTGYQLAGLVALAVVVLSITILSAWGLYRLRDRQAAAVPALDRNAVALPEA